MATVTDVPTAISADAKRADRRSSVAIALFGTWMVVGLFLDGWAHQAQKPETFFSPWHGVLYSGFGAAVAFFVVDGWRASRRGAAQSSERLVSLGLLAFGVAAAGDFVWHEIFGIEVDLEALLSPTHLTLMTGGLLMVTGPVRLAWRDGGREPSMRQFAPVLASMTLATAVVSFFFMYVSAFETDAVGFRGARGDWVEVWGLASILITNAILLAPMLLVVRRWTPPLGSFLVMFTAVAVLMSGLEAFERFPLVLAAAAGGVAADLLVRRSPRVLAAGVPFVLWTSWFAVHALVWGVAWTVELWTGAIILATLSGVGLSLLAFPPDAQRALD